MLGLEIVYGSPLPSLTKFSNRSESNFSFPEKNFTVCVSKWNRTNVSLGICQGGNELFINIKNSSGNHFPNVIATSIHSIKSNTLS